MRYRAINWPDTTRHDLEVLASWIDCGQALAMLTLAAGRRVVSPLAEGVGRRVAL